MPKIVRRGLRFLGLGLWRFGLDVGSGIRKALVALGVGVVLVSLGIQGLDVAGVLDEGFASIGALLDRMADELARLTGAVESGVAELEAIENDLEQ